jgi:hypothetical protein
VTLAVASLTFLLTAAAGTFAWLGRDQVQQRS